MGATAKTFIYGDRKAREINLLGEASIKAESAEHIINFPGGSLAVTRTSDNQYWVHVEVYQGEVIGEGVRESKNGEIVRMRLDTPEGVQVVNELTFNHLGLLIKTK